MSALLRYWSFCPQQTHPKAAVKFWHAEYSLLLQLLQYSLLLIDVFDALQRNTEAAHVGVYHSTADYGAMPVT